MIIEKIDNTIGEYNYLLSSQLEEQRTYFEEKIENRLKAFSENQEVKMLDFTLKELRTVTLKK